MGRKAPQADDHHSDVDVDRIPDKWQNEAHEPIFGRPSVSQHQPSVLCMPNTTPRSSTTETDGHLLWPSAADPVLAVFLVATPLPAIPPSPASPNRSPRPWQQHDRAPSVVMVSSPRTRRSARPESSENRPPLLSRKMVVRACP